MQAVKATYRIEGMTCAHCVRAVTEALESVNGVESAMVDLESGLASITSKTPIDLEALRSAVEEEGYGIAPASA